MEELREVTLHNMNCTDPVKRAARQQRVLQSELDGTVEATAANFIQDSTSAAMVLADANAPQILIPASQALDPQAAVPSVLPANPTKKR